MGAASCLLCDPRRLGNLELLHVEGRGGRPPPAGVLSSDGLQVSVRARVGARKLKNEQTRPPVCPKCKSPYWDNPFRDGESILVSE